MAKVKVKNKDKDTLYCIINYIWYFILMVMLIK